MSADVKSQIIDQMKASPLFSFQVDESTDISSCSQLLVFTRYVYMNDIQEEFLFCTTWETTTKAEDILETLKTFFEMHGLQWKNVCGVYTDGAPAMLGSKSGFQAKGAKGVHCMIHRYALSCKTLPTPLQNVLDSVIKVVNYIKTAALNTRLFKALCRDMNSDHETLLYYTNVRWLSKGNVLNRVFELREKIMLFLDIQMKHDLRSMFEREGFSLQMAYLADIFDHLNQLNLKLQGKDIHLFYFSDSIRAFVAKLKNWRRKLNTGNVAMFEKLRSVLDKANSDLNEDLKSDISKHLESLENEFQKYFPELMETESSLVIKPFTADVSDLPDDAQDEFLDLQNDSSARDAFKEKSLSQFWCAMYSSYPKVAMIALKLLVPFASTYLCEAGFSTLLHIKTKQRNRLNAEDDMRLALSVTQPRIPQLAYEIQPQTSH